MHADIFNRSDGTKNIVANINFDTQNTWGTANLAGIPALFEAEGDGDLSEIIRILNTIFMKLN